MTYVGAVPTTGDFKKLDSITTSSSTTFNLRQGGVAVYPQSANHCIVSLNGVIQAPVDAFTIVNDTIVFASSLASSDVINFILVLGNVNDIGTVSDDTVSTAKLQANAVTTAKITDGNVTAAKFNADVISGQTELAAEPADTDEFLVSDAGVIKRIDYSHIKGGGGLVYVGGGSTTSNVAAITLDNVFSATYDNYLLVFDMTSNENGDALLHFRSAGGSPATQDGTAYRYACMGLDTGGGSETAYGNNNSTFQMGHGMYDHEELDYPAMSGFIYFNSPFSSSHVKSFNGNFHNRASNGETRGFAGGGCFANQTSCGGVRLSFSSGSVNNGTARMYGLVNS